MIFKDDIITRIKADFGSDADKAMTALNEAIEKTDYLNSDRIIRCIVFLAEGNLSSLNEYISAAITDWRDIILWAEYEYLGEHLFPRDNKRLRDFNKAFAECEIAKTKRKKQ